MDRPKVAVVTPLVMDGKLNSSKTFTVDEIAGGEYIVRLFSPKGTALDTQVMTAEDIGPWLLNRKNW